MKLNYELKVKHHFEAAHFLPRGPTKCRTIHGHRWEVEVVILRQEFDHVVTCPGGTGMIVDFTMIKRLIDELDHPPGGALNELPGYTNPTAEVIATYLFHTIVRDLNVKPSELTVQVWESPDCSVKVWKHWDPITGSYPEGLPGILGTRANPPQVTLEKVGPPLDTPTDGFAPWKTEPIVGGPQPTTASESGKAVAGPSTDVPIPEILTKPRVVLTDPPDPPRPTIEDVARTVGPHPTDARPYTDLEQAITTGHVRGTVNQEEEDES